MSRPTKNQIRNRYERRHVRRDLVSLDPAAGYSPRERRQRGEPGPIRTIRRAATTPTTLDRQNRSVMATCSTDTPVRIYDWGTDKTIDEVLIPSGFKTESDSIELLQSHDWFNVQSVLGGVDMIRTNGNGVDCRLTFSAAPDVEPIFIRVAEGFLKNVSIGASYSRNDYIEIDPGKSRAIGGYTYFANDVPMRLVKKWNLIEVSVVVFGADKKAKMRGDKRLDNLKIATPRNRLL